jgi:hypothetical protein
MPERQAFIDSIKGVEREASVVSAAIAYFGSAVEAGGAILPTTPTRTSPRDFVAAAVQVEPTYLIRMWAEFEMALRSFHLKKTGDDDIQASNLVGWTTGVKQGRAISDDVRDLVHEVREYRSYLVHGRPAPAVSIEQARKRLNTLLGCLPINW